MAMYCQQPRRDPQTNLLTSINNLLACLSSIGKVHVRRADHKKLLVTLGKWFFFVKNLKQWWSNQCFLINFKQYFNNEFYSYF